MSNFPFTNGLSVLNKLGTVEDFNKESEDLSNIIKMDSFFFDSGIVEEVEFKQEEIKLNNPLSVDETEVKVIAPIIRLARVFDVNFDSFKTFSDMKLFAGTNMSKLLDQAGLLTMAGVMHHLPDSGKFEFGNPDVAGTDLPEGGLVLCSPEVYKKMMRKGWLTFYNDGGMSPIMKLRKTPVSMINFPMGEGFIYIEKNAFLYTERTNPRARMEVDRKIGQVDQLSANHVFVLQPKGFSLTENVNSMITDTPFEDSQVIDLSNKDSWRVVDESKIGIRFYQI